MFDNNINKLKSYDDIKNQLEHLGNQIIELEQSLSLLNSRFNVVKNLDYCKWILINAQEIIDSLVTQIESVKKETINLQDLDVFKNFNQLRERLSDIDKKILEQKSIQQKTERDIKECRERVLRLRDLYWKFALTQGVVSCSRQFKQNSFDTGLDNIQIDSFNADDQINSLLIAQREAQLRLDSLLLRKNTVEKALKEKPLKEKPSDIEVQKVQVLIVQLDRIKRDMNALSSLIIQAETLHTMAKQNTLFSAVIKGNIDLVVHTLSQEETGNPNQLYEGKKPIYYAAICGHLEIFNILLDCMDLKEDNRTTDIFQELVEKLNQLQGIDIKFQQMRDMLDLFHYAKSFDHLWKKDLKPQDGMYKVFNDYYSPVLFDHLSILPPTINRILMFAWNRSEDTLTLAKSICQNLDSGKKGDISIAGLQKELTRTHQQFQELVGQKQANSRGTFARRLYYCAYRLGIKLEFFTDMDLSLIEPNHVKNHSSFFAIEMPETSTSHSSQHPASVVIKQ